MKTVTIIRTGMHDFVLKSTHVIEKKDGREEKTRKDTQATTG